MYINDPNFRLTPVTEAASAPNTISAPESAVATKAGDYNNDNAVNYSDYEVVYSNFGNPYTVLDYNSVITNYEK
jgi:hypothetical protein